MRYINFNAFLIFCALGSSQVQAMLFNNEIQQKVSEYITLYFDVTERPNDIKLKTVGSITLPKGPSKIDKNVSDLLTEIKTHAGKTKGRTSMSYFIYAKEYSLNTEQSGPLIICRYATGNAKKINVESINAKTIRIWSAPSPGNPNKEILNCEMK
jgi:hypothetical protein